MLLGAGAFGLPLPLLPLQILWLNLATDTFPALALALGPAEPDVMQRPPRDPQQAILSRTFLRRVALYAALIAAPTLAAFAWGLSDDAADSKRPMTLAFMPLALGQTLHLANARQRGHVLAREHATSNPYALGAVAIVLVLQLAAVYLPPLALVLDKAPLALRDWFVVFALGAIPAVVGQAVKLVSARKSPRED